MKIEIMEIPHKEQRYNTVGDWQYDLEDDLLKITVSEGLDSPMRDLIVIHELVEALLCFNSGVTQQEVDEFDMKSKEPEPGSNFRAPYYRQHKVAGIVEQICAFEMDVDWLDYEKAVFDTWNRSKSKKHGPKKD